MREESLDLSGSFELDLDVSCFDAFDFHETDSSELKQLKKEMKSLKTQVKQLKK